VANAPAPVVVLAENQEAGRYWAAEVKRAYGEEGPIIVATTDRNIRGLRPRKLYITPNAWANRQYARLRDILRRSLLATPDANHTPVYLTEAR
jgi:hypothetical protein